MVFKVSLILLALTSTLVSAYPASSQYASHIEARAVKDEYDYIIVGGGTAGLTVGDRLTADGKYTVLVIENGVLDNSTAILTGGAGGGMNAARMYTINSSPQSGLNNRVISVGIGRVVGGSSAVNGMVVQRGTAEEYNLWGDLSGGQPTSWNWKGLLPSFRRAMHLTVPSENLQRLMNVTYDLSVWGQDPDTKVYATYSESGSGQQKFFYDAYKSYPGVHVPKDNGNGENGLSFFLVSMDPTASSRSYARTGHWDPVANRPNYELVTGQRVNKINFDSSITATGVTFVPVSGSGAATTVRARKEVILAAGTVHTPQVLELSGIGGADLLKKANIPVLVDLPGVGSNFHDHTYLPFYGIRFTKNPTYPTIQVPRAGNIQSANLGVFLGLPVVAPDAFERIASNFEAQDPAAYLPADTHPTIIEGYRQQQKLLGKAMRSKGTTFFNTMINGIGGAPQNLRPVSRGTIHINPSNPQGEPIVDYRALSNPIDLDVFVEFIKFFRRFHSYGTLAQYQAQETAPGANVQTDAQIATWLRGQLNPSVYHPVGTAAKMPREWGGVVSEDLLVWGTKKLSVIDGSIMPVIVGATTQQTVYAIAEKAAEIIKARQ
ncbi:alcohol oxidase [Ascobolus immersus RN42]|uniref:Alcohol oxidase n=1 Tax=Ascobolus immersus RN42 TaxID=1160509 RepID=A0A3N4I4Y9_ASCIM|nr:alcohol oxidase [Ascobolus immersus RN42]